VYVDVRCYPYRASGAYDVLLSHVTGLVERFLLFTKTRNLAKLARGTVINISFCTFG